MTAHRLSERIAACPDGRSARYLRQKSASVRASHRRQPMGQDAGMECFPAVPSALGLRPVWLTFLDSAADWRRLLEDDDWNRLIERERSPFGLLIAAPDAKTDLTAWSEFADYCVERELMLTASWGANSTVMDDLFDEAALGRALATLPGSEPFTSWYDDEPLEDALEFFLSLPGVDLRRGGSSATDWVRVVIVVNEADWLVTLRSALSAATATR
jgi:hypothetical protein